MHAIASKLAQDPMCHAPNVDTCAAHCITHACGHWDTMYQKQLVAMDKAILRINEQPRTACRNRWQVILAPSGSMLGLLIQVRHLNARE